MIFTDIHPSRRVLRLQSTSRFCKLGDLSNLVGWKHQATVKALEEKRKVRSKAAYAEKKKAIVVRTSHQSPCPRILARAQSGIEANAERFSSRASQAKAKAAK